MLDISNNLTLEQINYEEDASLSSISEIRYQEDYGFLNDFSFNRDHLALSQVRLQPQKGSCDIQFYEDGGQNGLNKRSNSRNGTISHRKIATLTLREDSFLKSPIKLPLGKLPIILRLNSKQSESLHGRLSKENGDAQIELFDKEGNRKGSFNYHLQTNYAHKQSQPALIEDDTLHSNQFLQQFLPIQKQVQTVVKPIKIKQVKQKRLDLENRTTLNNSIIQATKKQENSSDQGEQRSQKSEIDYLGYENYSKIEDRITDYRLPIHSKKTVQINKNVDYQSLKRSMEDLGLSNHSQIQTIFQQTKFRQYEQLKQAEQEQQQPFPVQTGTSAQVSFQDVSSQAESFRPELMQRGIGTYTPLPSRLNVEEGKNSSYLNRRQKVFKEEGIQYQQQYIPEEQPRQYSPPNKPQHIPMTHFVRSKQINSSFEMESIKPDNYHPIQKRPSQKQMSMRNNAYQIRIRSNRLNSRNGSRQSNGRYWMSCKQSSNNNNLSQSGQESILYPEVDIIINNLSVNFHRKSFGAKMLQMSIPPTTYPTEALAGNNLIWIGKEYLFKGVCGNNQMSISLKQNTEDVESTLAQVKIRVSDLILNKKKCYFQTFLLSKNEVVAILILGFQVVKRNYAVSKQVFPLKGTRQTHAQSQISRSKTTKIKRIQHKKTEKLQTKEAGLPSPRLNPIRVRKYQAGRNIKIGRASRFASDSMNIPGPGDYQIQSSFSRHAQKDI